MTKDRLIENSSLQNVGQHYPKVNIFADTPLTNYGGGEIVIISLYRFLVANNLDSIVYQPKGIKHVHRVSNEDIAKYLGTEITSVNYIKYGIIKRLFHPLPKPDDMNSDNINLIFLFRVPPSQYLKLLKKSKKNVIFCFHGISIEKLRLHPFIIFGYQLYLRFALRAFVKNIEGINTMFAQVLTDSMERQLQKYSSSNINVFKIENGLNIDDFSLGRNDDEFRIIFIGRLENLQKGISTLKEVILNSKELNVNYDIIGSGPDLKFLSDVPDNVSIKGFLPDEIKKSCLSKANLMVITSFMEPFSIVALEGLLSGLPVVSTPVSGPMTIISRNAEFGSISTFKPIDIVESLKKYYLEWQEDKQSYFNKKLKRRTLAAEYFKADTTYRKYLDMIIEMTE